MTGKEVVFADPQTRGFLLAAHSIQGLNRLLEQSKNPNLTVRDWNLTISYFASPNSLQRVGLIYGMTKTNTSIRVQKTINHLWNLCPPDIKQQFPLEKIPTDKPISLVRRQRVSLIGGGRSLVVSELVGQGLSVKEIKEKLQKTGHSLGPIRKVLASWDQTLGYINRPPTEYQQIRQALQKPLTDLSPNEKKLLQSLTLNEARRLARKPKYLISLNELVRSTGQAIAVSRIPALKESLEKNGLQVLAFSTKVRSGKNQGVIQKYYFLPVGEKPSAQAALNWIDSRIEQS